MAENKKNKGKLIVIEGIDGSGKQTQTQKLYDHLLKEGKKVMKLSYPRYDKSSSSMVKLYLNGAFGENPKEVSPYIASTFFTIDRYASYKEEYAAFLEAGGIVLTDRYTSSNMIHQGGKIKERGEQKKFLDWLWDYEFNLYELPVPDKVFFLNIPLDFSLQLIKNRENKITKTLEKDIHEKNEKHLRDAYKTALTLVKRYGWSEIKCVKALRLRDIESIHEELLKKIKEIL